MTFHETNNFAFKVGYNDLTTFYSFSDSNTNSYYPISSLIDGVFYNIAFLKEDALNDIFTCSAKGSKNMKLLIQDLKNIHSTFVGGEIELSSNELTYISSDISEDDYDSETELINSPYENLSIMRSKWRFGIRKTSWVYKQNPRKKGKVSYVMINLSSVEQTWFFRGHSESYVFPCDISLRDVSRMTNHELSVLMNTLVRSSDVSDEMKITKEDLELDFLKEN